MRMKQHSRRLISQTALNVVIILLIAVMLYPLAMAFWSALKNESVFRYSKWWPTLPLCFENIASAFKSLSRYMLNTVFVAGTGTLGMLVVSSLAAYSFSKLHFPGKNAIFMAVIALMMIPGILTLVPSFMLYKSIIGTDNYLILILPQMPDAVFEAARIDGASELKAYTHICLPLSMPIMGTLTVMQISGAWSDYAWPLITIKSEEYFTISLGLMLRYVGTTSTDYPHLTAGYLVASLPLIFLFIFANKFYVQGLTGSAMKL